MAGPSDLPGGGDDVLCRRVGGALELRRTPARVRIDLGSGLRSAEGHDLVGTFSVSIVPADTPADRRALADALLPAGREVVTVAAVAEALRPAVTQAAAEATVSRPAAQVLATLAELAGLVAVSADRAAFAIGLQVERAGATLRLHSPALDEQARHEQRVKQVDRAIAFSSRLRALQAANPAVPMAKLIEQLAPVDRGLAWRDLMTAEGAAARPTLWIAAGDSLLCRRPDGNIAPLAAPPGIGPLRSVAAAPEPGAPLRLLVGGAGGVAVIDLSGSNATVAMPSALRSERGFNRVVFCSTGRRVVASHSQFGVIAWSWPDGHELHRWPLPNAGNLVALDDGHLLVSSGRSVHVLRHGQDLRPLMTCDDDVVALAVVDDHCLAALAGGSVVAFGPHELTHRWAHVRPARVSAAAAWRSAAGWRMLRASESAGIECFWPDDTLVCVFEGPYRDAVAITAGRATVAAIASDRSRVAVWDAAVPQRTAAEVHVQALCGHPAADVAITDAAA